MAPAAGEPGETAVPAVGAPPVTVTCQSRPTRAAVRLSPPKATVMAASSTSSGSAAAVPSSLWFMTMRQQPVAGEVSWVSLRARLPWSAHTLTDTQLWSCAN